MEEKRRAESWIKLYEVLHAAQKRGEVSHGQSSLASEERPTIAVSQELDEIERERKLLENRDFAQNTQLKRRTLSLLFKFLAIETGVVFAFAFAQATRWPLDFQMEEWSFKILVTATIAQITGMLFVAVRYLFPAGTNGEK